MTRIIVTMLLLLGAAACGARPSAPERETLADWSEGPAHAPGGKRVQVWEQAVGGALGPATETPPLARFRTHVQGVLGPRAEQAALLEAKAAQMGADAHNARLVLDAGPAVFAPLTRLEVELLTEQMRRLDMVEHPSEVLAAVFRSPDGERLRVVTYTVNHAGIGRLDAIRPHIDAALADGWTFWLLWHNHNFFFDGREDVSGLAIPSSNDVRLLQAWREELGLREGWVTNGLVTGRYPSAVLERLRPAE